MARRSLKCRRLRRRLVWTSLWPGAPRSTGDSGPVDRALWERVGTTRWVAEHKDGRGQDRRQFAQADLLDYRRNTARRKLRLLSDSIGEGYGGLATRSTSTEGDQIRGLGPTCEDGSEADTLCCDENVRHLLSSLETVAACRSTSSTRRPRACCSLHLTVSDMCRPEGHPCRSKSRIGSARL